MRSTCALYPGLGVGFAISASGLLRIGVSRSSKIPRRRIKIVKAPVVCSGRSFATSASRLRPRRQAALHALGRWQRLFRAAGRWSNSECTRKHCDGDRRRLPKCFQFNPKTITNCRRPRAICTSIAKRRSRLYKLRNRIREDASHLAQTTYPPRDDCLQSY